MFYYIITAYCKDILGCDPWHFFDITQQSWCRIKKYDSLNLVQCKKICGISNSHITDNREELSHILVGDYYAKKENNQ